MTNDTKHKNTIRNRSGQFVGLAYCTIVPSVLGLLAYVSSSSDTDFKFWEGSLATTSLLACLPGAVIWGCGRAVVTGLISGWIPGVNALLLARNGCFLRPTTEVLGTKHAGT